MRVIQIKHPSELREDESQAINASLSAEEIQPFFNHDLELLIYWHARADRLGFGNAIVRKTGHQVWHYRGLGSCYCGDCPSPTLNLLFTQFGTLITLPEILRPVVESWEILPLIKAAHKVEEEAINEADINRSEDIFHR